jgi:hypothetical protein
VAFGYRVDPAPTAVPALTNADLEITVRPSFQPAGFRMPRWFLQRDRSSSTNSALNRTRYLRPLADVVTRAVSDYVAQRPDAEDVTLVVFESIGQAELERLGVDRTPHQRETDVGLFTAQTLVNLYGAERVATLRSDNGQDAHPRPNHRARVAWVTEFVPHRVLPGAPPSADRIILDTSTIRRVLHQDPDALDVAELNRLRGDHPVSLADGTIPELAAALTQGRLDVAVWANRIAVFDAVVDQDLPFAPGCDELAAIAGLGGPAEADLDEIRAFSRHAWTHFRSIGTADDIAKAGPVGRLDRTHVEGVLEGAANRWTEWVDGVRAEVANLAAAGDPLRDEEEVRDLLRHHLQEEDFSEQALDRLDVAVRVIARRTLQTGSADGYRPEGHNDALDFDLLFGLALPAIVCAADQRLINLARQTHAWDAWRMMSPQELIDWLQGRRR